MAETSLAPRKLPPQILCLEEMAAAAEGLFYRSRTPNWQLLIGLCGRGEVLHQEKWIRLRPGQAYLSAPRQIHAYRSRQQSAWKVARIVVAGRALASALFPSGPSHVLEIDPRPLVLAARGARRSAASPAARMTGNLWQDLIVHLLRNLLDQPQPNLDSRLACLWHHVLNTLDQDWNLDSMARHAGMCKEHLRRICIQAFGAAPIKRLADLRVMAAAQALFLTDRTLSEIAQEIGFGSTGAMRRHFVERYEITPHQFRRVCLQLDIRKGGA